MTDTYITPDEADDYFQKQRDEENQPAADEVPQSVKDAQAEIALEILGIYESPPCARCGLQFGVRLTRKGYCHECAVIVEKKQ